MFFILGYPRSGSSFLVQTIKNDPSVSIQHESSLITLILDACEQKNIDNNKLINTIVNKISKKSYRYTGLRDKDEIENLIFKFSKGEISTIDLIEHMIVDQSKKRSFKKFGDKYPNLTLELDKLYKLPDSKFIFLFRDPRDSYLSIKNTRFGPNTAFFGALHWRKYVRAFIKHKSLSSNYILVSYEGLINKPINELKKIYSYLDIKFNSSLHTNLEIKKNNHSKFKNEFLMSELENKIFEMVCKKEIKILGYDCNSNKLSLLDLFKVILISLTSIFIEFFMSIYSYINRS